MTFRDKDRIIFLDLDLSKSNYSLRKNTHKYEI